MTRRVCKGQRELSNIHDFQLDRCPYGIPGDRLWVRESFWIAEVEGQGIGNQFLVYDEEMNKEPHPSKLRPTFDMKWGHNPSIHMPRWASRLTLEITNARVERLQKISTQDAMNEGLAPNTMPQRDNDPYCKIDGTIRAFGQLWDSIYVKDTWEKNPWVWVIEFKRASTKYQYNLPRLWETMGRTQRQVYQGEHPAIIESEVI